jgi:thermostable 8-oxoguanine DNA glycosylase
MKKGMLLAFTVVARILARGYKIGTLYMTTNTIDTVIEAFGHRFWDDQNRKIIRSRKITFNE